MAKPRMDLSAFVGKLLEEQDGDVLREGHSGALAGADGNGGRRADRRGPSRAHARADGASQRLPDADVGHAGRHDRAGDSEGPARHVLSRRCCSRAGAPSTRCWPSCRRRTCTASRRGRSTS